MKWEILHKLLHGCTRGPKPLIKQTHNQTNSVAKTCILLQNWFQLIVLVFEDELLKRIETRFNHLTSDFWYGNQFLCPKKGDLKKCGGHATQLSRDFLGIHSCSKVMKPMFYKYQDLKHRFLLVINRKKLR
jgi:hypothetical protein